MVLPLRRGQGRRRGQGHPQQGRGHSRPCPAGEEPAARCARVEAPCAAGGNRSTKFRTGSSNKSAIHRRRPVTDAPATAAGGGVGSRRSRDGPRLLCGRWRRYGWRRCQGWRGRRRSVVAEPAERVAQDRQHDDRHGHDVVDRASTHRLGPSSTAIISGMFSPASSASPDEAGEGFGELAAVMGAAPVRFPL